MDVLEIKEKLSEIIENGDDKTVEKTDAERAESFRKRAALIITAMAVLLALTALGSGNALEDMMGSNIEAANAWNFYQAKNLRQV